MSSAPVQRQSDRSGERRHGRHAAAGPVGPGRRDRARRRQLPFWQELPLLVVAAVVLALLIKTFLVQAFFIPSGSMEQTLDISDRVLVNKVVYHFRQPHRGEVVVFNGVDSWTPESEVSRPHGLLGRVGGALGVGPTSEKDFVKRVVGLPGDTVACCDAHGRVTVNGRGLDEPYVYQNNPIETRAFGPVTVPAGRLWVMGDHRGISADSRSHITDQWEGTIPEDHVIGRAFVIVWPFGRAGGLPVPATFGSVPQHPAGPAPASGALLLLPLLPTGVRRRRRREAAA